jgi:hypothetical protein
MSQASNNSLALHEILLSIADSLNVAQNQLRSMPPYDEYGRPNTLYQLPYLDFSLEVISEAISETETTTPTNKAISNPELIRTTAFKKNNKITKQNHQVLAYRLPGPSQNKTTNNSASNKITSTISGRFVAVMPNEGVPQVFIVMDAEKVSVTKYKLKVKLTYATNEPVVGQKVEINFDEATSLALNETATSTTAPLFEPSKEGFTEGDGTYKTVVKIALSDVNKTIIFVANSGTLFTSVAISNT